jgi:heme-degrading monooxygenase HmoA
VIVRVWRGWTARADGDAYEEYMREVALPGYGTVAGNRGGYLLRRHDGERDEFCMVTAWESWEAIRAFAGDEPERAVFYPEDDRYLVQREERVVHYDAYATLPAR